MPRCHIFLRVFANGRYTLFSKLLYHLSFKASRATHQTQMFKRSATKVSEDDCQSGLNKNAAIMEISNALSIKTGVLSSLLNLKRISMISLFSFFLLRTPANPKFFDFPKRFELSDLGPVSRKSR